MTAKRLFPNDETSTLCEGHAHSFDAPRSIRVPAAHEQTDPEEPVQCDACSYAIMRAPTSERLPMTKALRPVPRPTLLGVAPPAPGAKTPPPKRLRPSGSYSFRGAQTTVIRVRAPRGGSR